jgi:hypothetical protein
MPIAQKKLSRPAKASTSRPLAIAVRQLERLVRSRFLDVIAGDRDRVELRHVRRRVLDDVAHDPHARRRRIDVGVADHELLQDVVLDRS